MDGFLEWFVLHWVEIAGAIAGVIYLVLSIRQNILLWPAGIINVSIYAYVFFREKLYADMILQFFYIAVSVQGFMYWMRRGATRNEFAVSQIKQRTALKILTVSLISVFMVAWFMKYYTDAALPVADSVITVVSLAATWMMVYKYLENWIVWIIIDAFAMGVYFIKGLYPTVALFAVYTLFAYAGYIEWKKTMACNSSQTQ